MAKPAVRVAVPVPVPGLFDYALPENSAAPPAGIRVKVPFGRRSVYGVVMEVGPASIDPRRLKPVTRELDRQPILDEHLRTFCSWLSRYYLHPIGEVVAAAIPSELRRGEPPRMRPPEPHWALTDEGRHVDPATLGRAVRQRAVLEHLAQGPARHGELLAETGADRSVCDALAAKGWIGEAEAAVAVNAEAPTLTPAQRAAVDAIRASEGFSAFLLNGVTGSGKTEVYLSAIEPIVAVGGQALVLVPEIGLTPQLIRRFERRLGDKVAAVHSGRSDLERLDVWERARTGRTAVVIGTRSALFTPLPELKLIVIDEEHDGSFKQQDGLHYSARDAAVKRAQMLDIPIVLGSATPSLESLHNAREGRYRQLRLDRRIGGATLPHAEVIDLRHHPAEDGISEPAYARIAHHLKHRDQVLVFLNRRGYAPVLMCHACGWMALCHRCDARLTLHQGAGQLRCHHCGSSQGQPPLCPECGSSRLLTIGEGTEKLQDTLAKRFPDHPVIRIDRDTIRSQRHLQASLELIRSGRSAILLGTQMLAKGHHFPKVTLSVVVNLDQALFSADFRASEKAAQLLLQVAGRAGRGERPGTLLLQTHHPEHSLFSTVLQEGYEAFAEELLRERQAAAFPPYGHLALLRAEASRREQVRAFLDRAASLAPRSRDVHFYGPMPAPLERRAGRMRMQVLVQSADRSVLFRHLRPWVGKLHELSEAGRVRWSIDVDPLEGV